MSTQTDQPSKFWEDAGNFMKRLTEFVALNNVEKEVALFVFKELVIINMGKRSFEEIDDFIETTHNEILYSKNDHTVEGE